MDLSSSHVSSASHAATPAVTNQSGSSHSKAFSSSSMLGSGLIDITALTALVGSNAAEQLALGNRGAAGFAWVGMSTFGSLSVLRACVAASTPGWLRETLGVRNANTDAAVGLSLDLGSAYMDREDRARKNLGPAVGVLCELSRKTERKWKWKWSLGQGLFSRTKLEHTTSEVEIQQLNKRDVYAFDQFNNTPVNSIAPFSPGSNQPPLLHVFVRDPYYKGPINRGDWIWLSLTLGKLLEMYVLYQLGAGTVAVVSGFNWSYFVVSATLLQHKRLSRGYREDFKNSGRLDIISGKLPTARQAGGLCRILLGAPKNFRHHTLWRVIWFFGAIIVAVSLISNYILLSSCPSVAVYAWSGFQIFWLLCRSLFFHVAEGTGMVVYPILKGEKWEMLSYGLKERVLELLLALCKHQIHVHPRGSYSYGEDVVELAAIRDLLARCTFVDEFPLDWLSVQSTTTSAPMTFGAAGTLDLTFRAAFSDSLLSCAAWFLGSKYTAMDLYDACVVFLEIPAPPGDARGTRLLAIPSARPLCASRPPPPPAPTDIEARNDMSELEYLEMGPTSPKGSPNDGIDEVEWVHWIPCSAGRWIQVRSDKMKMLGGTRRGEVITDEEVTRRLQMGILNIDLGGVETVWETVKMARAAAKMLVELFGVGVDVKWMGALA